jgi:hypothetical protein
MGAEAGRQVALTDAEILRFQRWLQSTAAICLSPVKKALVCGRLGKRMRRLQPGSYGDHFNLIAGGTQALEAAPGPLPPTSPGGVIVQHMPEKYTASFAARLDQIKRIRVREARFSDRLMSGCALVAPGEKHMLVKHSGAQYCLEVANGPLTTTGA